MTYQMMNLIAGAILVGWGRKVFWLFVAWLGFLTGFGLVGQIEGSDPNLALAIGVLLGVIGAAIALLLQQLAVNLAGFIAGGYLGYSLALASGLLPMEGVWLAAIVCGLVGILLMSVLFEGTLILFSSLVGATLIVNNIAFDNNVEMILLVLLTIGGLLFQTRGPKVRKLRPQTSH